MINDLIIYPAKFIEKIDENKSLLGLYTVEGDEVIIIEKKVDNNMIKHIENPIYLFVGLVVGENYHDINFTDAKEYENMFYEKWNLLTK